MMMKKINFLIVMILTLAMVAFINAPQQTVSGQVTSGGEPLPGVDVSVQSTNQGTVTNMQGNYSLEVGSEADTLVFSSLGYQTQKLAIGNKNSINVQMQEE